MKIAIDTNVLVRYLTWDDESQAQKVAELIEAADPVHVSTAVLCEVVWVLTRAYRYKANEIVPILEQLVAGLEFEIDLVAIRTGLRFLEAGGDFADGVILDDMQSATRELLATFDRDFARLIEPSKVVLLGITRRDQRTPFHWFKKRAAVQTIHTEPFPPITILQTHRLDF